MQKALLCNGLRVRREGWLSPGLHERRGVCKRGDALHASPVVLTTRPMESLWTRAVPRVTVQSAHQASTMPSTLVRVRVDAVLAGSLVTTGTKSSST